MAQLFARMNLILAMTSLLPYRLHAIWLNMAPIERQMRQSVKLFTDKFLVGVLTFSDGHSAPIRRVAREGNFHCCSEIKVGGRVDHPQIRSLIDQRQGDISRESQTQTEYNHHSPKAASRRSSKMGSSFLLGV